MLGLRFCIKKSFFFIITFKISAKKNVKWVFDMNTDKLFTYIVTENT